MKLYLVRHGNASAGSDDIARPLSLEGIEEVKKVAEFLKHSGCCVDIIYHSVRVRAFQTAKIIHERLAIKKKLVERLGLSPNDPVGPIADFVDQQKNDCMIVGHMPFVGSLVSLLVSGDDKHNLVAFPTGAVAILEKKHGLWLIAQMIDPKRL